MKETTEAGLLAAYGVAVGTVRYCRPEITAGRSWAAIAGFVALHEVLCPTGQTLSEGADKALERHPILTSLAIGVVATHLANLLPPKLDPLYQTLEFIKKL